MMWFTLFLKVATLIFANSLSSMDLSLVHPKVKSRFNASKPIVQIGSIGPKNIESSLTSYSVIIVTPASIVTKEKDLTLKLESQFCKNLSLVYSFQEIRTGCSLIMRDVAVLLTKICKQGFEGPNFSPFPDYTFSTSLLGMRKEVLTNFAGDKVYVNKSFYRKLFIKIDEFIALKVNEAVDFVANRIPISLSERYPYILSYKNIKHVTCHMSFNETDFETTYQFIITENVY